jgi:hypothetical protein
MFNVIDKKTSSNFLKTFHKFESISTGKDSGRLIMRSLFMILQTNRTNQAQELDTSTPSSIFAAPQVCRAATNAVPSPQSPNCEDCEQWLCEQWFCEQLSKSSADILQPETPRDRTFASAISRLLPSPRRKYAPAPCLRLSGQKRSFERRGSAFVTTALSPPPPPPPVCTRTKRAERILFTNAGVSAAGPVSSPRHRPGHGATRPYGGQAFSPAQTGSVAPFPRRSGRAEPA